MPDLASALAEEDQLRANMYGLLSGLLLAAPSEATLASIAALSGDDTPIGRATADLAALAGSTPSDAVKDEYNTLFIGIGRGELVPYGSYYLTGFLNEKPLAKLRNSLAELGIERREDMKDPEDHVGTLFEVMAGLITGAYGYGADHATQQRVFSDHIAPWAGHFFADLAKADSAHFYRPVGRIGQEFCRIEAAAFEMA